MAENKNKWTNVSADFSGASSLMQGASESVADAGKTVNDILQNMNIQKTRDERTKMMAMDRQRQASMDNASLMEKQEKEEFKNTLAETTTNLMKDYRDFKGKSSDDNSNITIEDYFNSDRFKSKADNTDPRLLQSAIDLLVEKSGNIEQTVNRSLDRASKERQFKQAKIYDEYSGIAINTNLNESEIRKKLDKNNVPSAVRDDILNTNMQLRQNIADAKNSEVQYKRNKWQHDNEVYNKGLSVKVGNNYADDIQEAQNVNEKISTSMKYAEIALAQGLNPKPFLNNAKTYSLLQSRKSDGSGNGEDNFKKSISKDRTNLIRNGINQTNKELGDIKVEATDLEKIHDIQKIIASDGGYITATQILAAMSQEGRTSGIGFKGVVPYGKGDITLKGEDANVEIDDDVTDAFVQIDGKQVINPDSKLGIKILANTMINAQMEGKDFNEIPILKRSLDYNNKIKVKEKTTAKDLEEKDQAFNVTSFQSKKTSDNATEFEKDYTNRVLRTLKQKRQ